MGDWEKIPQTLRLCIEGSPIYQNQAQTKMISNLNVLEY